MDYDLDILVVDDSKFFAEGMKTALMDLRLKVVALTDSTKAIDYIRKLRPRFVLLDIMMPVIDGLNLLKMIKAEDDFQDLRVAMLSSKGFNIDREKSYQAGAEAFIEKADPFDVLAKRVKKLFNETIKVKFWGTRGSIPVPGKDTIKYGGNTPCVEVCLGGDSIIIFDAGTGIRVLGDALIQKKTRVRAHIFFTHFHWDHIQGFPFFAPAYQPENHIIFYGYEDKGSKLGKIISDQMESVYYPVPMTRLGANIQFQPLIGNENYQIENFKISTFYLMHPGNTIGYLLSHHDIKIAYLTDNELVSEKYTGKGKKRQNIENSDYNKNIINFSKGVDLLIIDAQYSNEKYQHKQGWGHSRYSDVLEMGMAAGVKKLALFHHDPTHNDDLMDNIVSECQSIIKKRGLKMECFGAQEGMEISFQDIL